MPLVVINRREEMRSFIREQKAKKKQIGFVPTMGALHKGHASLIQKCSEENDLCVVSIFVNPKQFGANEDLSKYPRQFQQDCEICEAHGAHVLFSPGIEEVYPKGFSSQVIVQNMTNILCGKYRPGHFDGVTTIVLILLNIIHPDYLYLGQKDFQQVEVIKKMCTDLLIPTQIKMLPTVREKGGLALSSRNTYLTEETRKIADTIPKALAEAAKLFLNGERSSKKLLDVTLDFLKTSSLVPQYLELRQTQDLTIEVTSQLEEDCVLALAQPIPTQGMTVRLIDNIILSRDSVWVKILEEFIHLCQNN